MDGSQAYRPNHPRWLVGIVITETDDEINKTQKRFTMLLTDLNWRCITCYLTARFSIVSFNRFLDFTKQNWTFKINWMKTFLCRWSSSFAYVCKYDIAKLCKQAFGLISYFKHNLSPQKYLIWNNCDTEWKNNIFLYVSPLQFNITTIDRTVWKDFSMYSGCKISVDFSRLCLCG